MNTFTKGEWYIAGDDEVLEDDQVVEILCGDMPSPECRIIGYAWNNSEEGFLSDEDWANAELIATAGTAATKLAEQGYDVVKCIEMLPEIVPLIKDAMRSIDYEHGPGASDVNFPELTNFLDAIKAGGEQ